MYAARQGSLDAAKALLDSGANIDAASADKSTALLFATINAHFDLAEFLVDHGANVNVVSMDGANALYGVVNTQWARKSFQPQPSPRSVRGTLSIRRVEPTRTAAARTVAPPRSTVST